MQNRTDEDLVRAVIDGDVSAFENLVRRYQRKLYTIAYYYVRDRHAAEDVVQESFIHFYTHIENIDVRKKISSYISVIAKNSALSYLRTRKRHAALEDAEGISVTDLPEDEMIRKEKRSVISRALAKLHPKYRNVLMRYYFDEETYQEMSRQLHIPINTIRTHLKRGKKLLSGMLTYENY